jgi:uncharacterized protein (TIGR00369 family)
VAAEIRFVRTGDANCFGCGDANAHGLRLAFRQVGGRAVEANVTVPAHFAGPPGVVHGGIQATVLDEVMGKAAYTAFPERYERLRFVTAEMSVRYRRPALAGAPLVAPGEVVRVDADSVHLRGALLDGTGSELTTATSRWKVIGVRG